MGVLLEQHGHVIALYPSALPEDFTRRLYTVRSLLESDRIALLGLDLPPLAVAVIALQLRQLSVADLTPGVLASAARLLAHYVHAGALLGSVARLDHVAVGLKSHLKSWMPGSHFGVLAAPKPLLVEAGPETVPEGPGFATSLTVARGQLQSDWVTGALARQWQVTGLQEALLPEDSPRWWGTAKMIEFVAAIPDPALLYRLVASVRRDTCYWCGMHFIGERCAFCCAPLPPPENRTGPHRVLSRGTPVHGGT
jgi:hypothetical protein